MAISLSELKLSVSVILKIIYEIDVRLCSSSISYDESFFEKVLMFREERLHQSQMTPLIKPNVKFTNIQYYVFLTFSSILVLIDDIYYILVTAYFTEV